MIKMAPVIIACEVRGLATTLLLTGQHRETMQDLIREFGVNSPPEVIISEMERATVGSLMLWLPRATWRVSQRISEMRNKGIGCRVLVHGDTLSTLLGAVAARVGGAQLLHLESGLSSGKILDPFPEELCRRLVFRLTDVAFCPDTLASDYMRKHHDCEVVDTHGNTVMDAVRMSGALNSTTRRNGELVVSIHRVQNIFSAVRLRSIVTLIRQISEAFQVHFVLHPATRMRLEALGLLSSLEEISSVTLSPRMGYGKFLALAGTADCVLTDGGSNQEELAILGVPTVILRERTERTNGLGRNAIMEADIPGGVARYLLSGAHASLRVPAARRVEHGPSERIADYLAERRDPRRARSAVPCRNHKP